MTQAEFDEWAADVRQKFPAVGLWWREMKTAAGPLLADWCEALSGCDLADCLAVNRRMLAGDEDGPGKFPSDWQSLPAMVKRAAGREAFRRIEGDRGERLLPNLDGPRHRCAKCRDGGRVFVAHPELFRAWLDGRLASCKYTTAVTRCTCGLIPSSNDVWQRERQATLFNAECHFQIPWQWFPIWESSADEPRRLEMLTEFSAWADKAWNAWQNRKRHSEFDDFNARNS